MPSSTWASASILAKGPPPPTISSGNSLQMTGFDVNHSMAFWSVTRLGNRIAATLHLFFNDTDQAELRRIAAAATTPAELMAALTASPVLGGTPMVARLRELTRPIVTRTQRTHPDTGHLVVTLTGEGLAGATAVTVGGAPAQHLQVRGDGVVEATLPAGTAGDVVLTTPLGQSEPVALP